MSQFNVQCTVMFADIVGSTRLYEILGDQKAKSLVSAVLCEMEAEISKYGGELIKTIGDELMVKFPHPDPALDAAVSINQLIETKDFGYPMSVRIGLHHDDMLYENNDLFGDGVNLAARVAGLARAKQVLTTKSTYDLLSTANRLQCRLIDQLNVKGKQDSVQLYEAIWEHEDEVTLISSSMDVFKMDSKQTKLVLTYHGNTFDVTPGQSFSLGRSPQTDCPVGESLASRLHGRIEYRRDKFVFVDQSTNGSYVKIQGIDKRFVKREELALWGEGIISLGADIDETQNPVYFSCCTK